MYHEIQYKIASNKSSSNSLDVKTIQKSSRRSSPPSSTTKLPWSPTTSLQLEELPALLLQDPLQRLTSQPAGAPHLPPGDAAPPAVPHPAPVSAGPPAGPHPAPGSAGPPVALYYYRTPCSASPPTWRCKNPCSAPPRTWKSRTSCIASSRTRPSKCFNHHNQRLCKIFLASVNLLLLTYGVLS